MITLAAMADWRSMLDELHRLGGASTAYADLIRTPDVVRFGLDRLDS